MKKFVYCIMLFLMVASFCFVPKIYARANTISNTEIEEIAPDNSGNDLENNVVQDLEIEEDEEDII